MARCCSCERWLNAASLLIDLTVLEFLQVSARLDHQSCIRSLAFAADEAYRQYVAFLVEKYSKPPGRRSNSRPAPRTPPSMPCHEDVDASSYPRKEK